MSRGAASILGERLIGGVVVSDHQEDVPPQLRLLLASHPFPDDSSVAAGRVLLEEASIPGDLLVLISGGASALAEVPVAGIGIEDVAQISRDLMRVGTPIGEINTVRRHLSCLKNGGLLRAAGMKKVVTLLMADVVDDDPASIGSGPTLADHSTPQEALEVIRSAGLRVSPAVGDHLSKQASTQPSPDHEWHVVANGSVALGAVERSLQSNGLMTFVYDSSLKGGASTRAIEMIAATPEGQVSVAAGETTVVVTGTGLGGRNQHAALTAALELAGTPGVFAAVGTDGIDGPTTAAGAIVDGGTVARATAAGIDPSFASQHCDSNHALAASGDLLILGPTGTNVGDIWLSWTGP
jgi:hydroxypyruvate reductase